MSTTRTGQCHCGAVRFEVDFANGIGALNRCNCSICRKKGAVMASVSLANFRLIAGGDESTLYQWNTNIAKHHFCSICGIYTHHRRRSEPDQIAINVACLDGPDVTIGREIGMLNGVSNSLVGEGKTKKFHLTNGST